MKRSLHIFVVSFSILVLGLLTLSTLSLGPNPIFEDDAFFYWVGALRTVETGFPTFDGFEQTSGFHWLWFTVLTFIAYISSIFSTSSLTIKSIFLIFPSLIVWGAVFRGMSLSVMSLALISALFVGFSMETAMAGLFFGIALLKMLENQSSRIWIFLAVLSRVDMLIPAFILTLIVTKKERLFLIFIISCAVFLSVIFNQIIFGEFFSISSEIKASRALNISAGYFANFLENFSSLGNIYRYSIVIFLNLNLYFLIIFGNRTHTRKLLKCLCLFLAINSFLIFHTFFSILRDWYFAPSIISLLLLNNYYLKNASILISKLSTYAFNLLSVAGIILLISYSTYFASSWKSGNEFYKNACKILEGDRVFVYDGSGKLAWNLFKCASITNGDGLMNSHKYYNETIKNNNYKEYLKNNNIRFYITNVDNAEYYCPVENICFNNSEVRLRLQSTEGSKFTSYQLVEILY